MKTQKKKGSQKQSLLMSPASLTGTGSERMSTECWEHNNETQMNGSSFIKQPKLHAAANNGRIISDINNSHDIQVQKLSTNDRRQHYMETQNQLQREQYLHLMNGQKVAFQSLNRSGMDSHCSSIKKQHHYRHEYNSLISDQTRTDLNSSCSTRIKPQSAQLTQSQSASKSESSQGFQKYQQQLQQQQQQEKSYSKLSQAQQKLHAMLVEPKGFGMSKFPLEVVAAVAERKTSPNGSLSQSSSSFIPISKSFNQNNQNSSNHKFPNNNYLSSSQKSINLLNNEQILNTFYASNRGNSLALNPPSNSSAYLSKLQEQSPFRKTRQSLEIKTKPILTEENHAANAATRVSSKNWSSLIEQQNTSHQLNLQTDGHYKHSNVNHPSSNSCQQSDSNPIDEHMITDALETTNGSAQNSNSSSKKNISNGCFSLGSQCATNYPNHLNTSHGKSTVSPHSNSSAGIARSNDRNSKKSHSHQQQQQQFSAGIPSSASSLLQSPSSSSVNFTPLFQSSSFSSYTPLNTLLSAHPLTSSETAASTFIQQVKEKIMKSKYSASSQTHSKNSKSASISKNPIRPPSEDGQQDQIQESILKYEPNQVISSPISKSSQLMNASPNGITACSKYDFSYYQPSSSPSPSLLANQRALLSASSRRDQHTLMQEKQKTNLLSKTTISLRSPPLHAPAKANTPQPSAASHNLIIDDSVILSNATTNCRTATSASCPGTIKLPEFVAVMGGENNSNSFGEGSLEEFLQGNRFSLENKQDYFQELIQALREASSKSKSREAQNLSSKNANKTSEMPLNFTNEKNNQSNLQPQLFSTNIGYSECTQQTWKLLDNLVSAMEGPIQEVLNQETNSIKAALAVQNQKFQELLRQEKEAKIELAKKLRDTEKQRDNLLQEIRCLKQNQGNIQIAGSSSSNNNSHDKIEQAKQEQQGVQELLSQFKQGSNSQKICENNRISNQDADQKRTSASNLIGQIDKLENVLDPKANKDLNEGNNLTASPQHNTNNPYDTSQMSDGDDDASSSVLSLCVNEGPVETKISEALKGKLKINLSSLNPAVITAQSNNKSSILNPLGIPKDIHEGESLQLQDIYGYHDEFMNKFDEFSQSWRDAIIAEQRYPSETPQPVAHVQLKDK